MTTVRPDELVVVNESPYCAETPHEQLRHAITPSASHFVRSNFPVPALDDDHRIVIEGAVQRSHKVSLDELRSMPRATVTVTLECAGNDRTSMAPIPAGEPWRMGAVSTARWSGARLLDVLAGARLKPEAVAVAFEGADRGSKTDAAAPLAYERALPLDALGPDVLLAYEMNGEPLAPSHGGPLRLIVPGWYGMASVKWLARIVARTTPLEAYFQTQRYVYVYDYGDAVVPVTCARVKSMIVEPADGASVHAGEALVWGWAWSGDGPIERVEVRDGSSMWKEAELDAPVGAYAWRRWQCRLDVRPGSRALQSRATDARGNTQPETVRWNRLGYGNNAIRTVAIDVR